MKTKKGLKVFPSTYILVFTLYIWSVGDFIFILLIVIFESVFVFYYMTTRL